MQDASESEKLRDVMAAVGIEQEPVSLYDDLAPVWDFVIARRFDYDALADFVTDQAPVEASSVAVLACGPGRLLARLADRYDDAVGIDRSPGMCDLARERTDATVVEADMLQYDPASRFDVVTLLGNTVIHVGPSALRPLFETVYTILAPGGMVLCDFNPPRTFQNGNVIDQSYESDAFRVERTMVTTLEDRDTDVMGAPARFTYSFTIIEKPNRGRVSITIADEPADEAVRTGTSMPVRLYTFGELSGVVTAVGFDEVLSVEPPSPHEGGLAARKTG